MRPERLTWRDGMGLAALFAAAGLAWRPLADARAGE
jgi:hypothetical protein